jgi:uncharacterized metal-binding protein YceD (DUF177 family)
MTPEFSRPIAVDRVGLKEKSFSIEANAKERKALAERLGIPEVTSVTADIALRLTHGGKILLLKGRVRAELVQSCVVTLEPVRNHIDEEFALTYSTENGRQPAEVVIDLAEEDPPEPVQNGQIDMGEAAAEHLALAMDPFPRAPGVSFQPPPPPAASDDAADGPKPSPFEVLAEHRKKV